MDLRDGLELVTLYRAVLGALTITKSVSQGSALSPLAFFVLVNDLSFSAVRYPDDTTLIYRNSDLATLVVDAELAYK